MIPQFAPKGVVGPVAGLVGWEAKCGAGLHPVARIGAHANEDHRDHGAEYPLVGLGGVTQVLGQSAGPGELGDVVDSHARCSMGAPSVDTSRRWIIVWALPCRLSTSSITGWRAADGWVVRLKVLACGVRTLPFRSHPSRTSAASTGLLEVISGSTDCSKLSMRSASRGGLAQRCVRPQPSVWTTPRLTAMPMALCQARSDCSDVLPTPATRPRPPQQSKRP